MTYPRLIARSLFYYRRTGALVAFGVAVAMAVLTGSLLVGDSVRGSLRDSALARLGGVEYAVISPGFFRAVLDHKLAEAPSLARRKPQTATLLALRGMARHPETETVAPNVAVIGVDAAFRRFHPGFPPDLPGREAAVSAALARDLGLKPGNDVLVTVPRGVSARPESLFAHRRRARTTRTLRLTVARVLPDAGAGGFALDAGTSLRRNIFVSREWLAEQAGLAGRANTLLVSVSGATDEKAGALREALAQAVLPEDQGLKVVPIYARGCLSVQSTAITLSDRQANAVLQAARDIGAPASRSSVYLAFTVRASSGRRAAYVVMAGVEGGEGTAEAETHRLPIQPRACVLTRWLADDLGARVGERVDADYPVSSWDGAYQTRTARFTVRDIVETERAADPGLVPAWEGITDARTMGDWDPPFPVDMNRVTPRDEAYWDRHQAAPKAFIGMDAVRAMWQSGPAGADTDWITSVRVMPREGQGLATLEREFQAALVRRLLPEQTGLAFRPVRQQALVSAAGATDYGQLFLAMSFFLVAAAAGLAAMMMRLMVERRAAQVGLMRAGGFSTVTIRRILLAEGAGLALLGAGLGAPLGVLFARGVLYALATWWSGAIGTFPVRLHVEAASMAIGSGLGLLVGIAATAWGARSFGRVPVLRLLSGWQATAVMRSAVPARRGVWLLVLLLAGVVVLFALAAGGILSTTTAFFAGGAVLLALGLAACDLALTRMLRTREAAPSLPRLAIRNAAAHRAHSVLTVGLLGAAVFLLVIVAASTRDFDRADWTRRDSGTGGFALVATSAMPITFDLNSPTGRRNMGFSPEDEKVFQDVTVVPFLVSSGEDVSCLNLAKPTAPRVLGVAPAMVTRGGFRISAPNIRTGNPWRLLTEPSRDGIVPAFGDADSVQWQLHSGPGEVYSVPDANGRPTRLRFKGLIHRSLFAGELLVSEEQFRRMYPSVTAQGYFLIETPPGREGAVSAALRRNLGEMGLEVRTTREVLNAYIGVQNAYLSTFLALGGLGLLLGTVGLATVLLRNALERRGEFALLLATGFRRSDMTRLLALENAGLLLAGVLGGAACALLAVAPQLASTEARVNGSAVIGLLAGTIAIGMAACVVAARAAVQGRLIEALRSE